RPNGSDDVVPDAPIKRPRKHFWQLHPAGICQVLLLTLINTGSHGLIVQQNIVLVVQVEAAQIQVGRTNQADFTVYGKSFCMQQAMPVLVNPATGIQQLMVVTVAGSGNNPAIVTLG